MIVVVVASSLAVESVGLVAVVVVEFLSVVVDIVVGDEVVVV